jgi:RNA polymerase sigma-70 factor (ECF subfamily)
MSEASGGGLTQARLEALYVKLEKPIYNVVFRWVWNRHEAQDITQEAFLRVWNMRQRVLMETVEALLYRVALNLASNRRRAQKVRQWLLVDEFLPFLRGEERPDPAVASQETRRVRDAINALPEPLRQVITLTELAGLTYPQVAQVLSIPEGTVGSRRNKAVSVLRQALGDLMEEVSHAGV